jgi:hypothetical protein
MPTVEQLQKELKSHVEYEQTLLDELLARGNKIDALLRDGASRDLAIIGLRQMQEREADRLEVAYSIVGELETDQHMVITKNLQMQFALWSALEDSRWVEFGEEYGFTRGVYVIWTPEDKLHILVFVPGKTVFPACKRFFRLPTADESNLRKNPEDYCAVLFHDSNSSIPIEDMVCDDESGCPGCAETCFKAKPSATDELVRPYIGGGDDEE